MLDYLPHHNQFQIVYVYSFYMMFHIKIHGSCNFDLFYSVYVPGLCGDVYVSIFST